MKGKLAALIFQFEYLNKQKMTNNCFLILLIHFSDSINLSIFFVYFFDEAIRRLDIKYHKKYTVIVWWISLLQGYIISEI